MTDHEPGLALLEKKPALQKMNSETTGLINNQDVQPKRSATGMFESIIQPCLAEMVAVMLFVFVGTLSVQDGEMPPTGPPSVVAVAIAHGFMIALLVAGTGHISGGHINPAVTLGVTLAGGISPLLAVGYVIFQLFGGILGAAACRGVLSYTVQSENMTAYHVIGGGAHNLATGVTPAMGILCETGLTLALVMTVLLTAVDTKGKNVVAPLAIGFTVCADILAGINVTGASMNPARSFGPAVMLSSFDSSIWDYHYVYWVGPAMGACLAGLLYRFIFADRDKRLVFKSE